MSENTSKRGRPLKRLKKRKSKYFTAKRATCGICGMTFKSAGIRNMHLSIHSDHKDFSCEICLKEFRRKDMLKTHYTTHFKGYNLTKQDIASMPLNVLCLQYKPIVRPKQYTCPSCPKVFSKRGSWRNHFIKHTDFKPFCCQICSKGFKTNYALRGHFANCHTDYLPNYKDYSYIDEMNVVDNVDKKYQCDMCSKFFGCKDSVKLHLFSHLDLKPFECRICSKGFRSKPQLRKHLRQHMESGLGTSVTQLTLCKEEVDIDDHGSVTIFNIKPSKVVLRRMECDLKVE